MARLNQRRLTALDDKVPTCLDNSILVKRSSSGHCNLHQPVTMRIHRQLDEPNRERKRLCLFLIFLSTNGEAL